MAATRKQPVNIDISAEALAAALDQSASRNIRRAPKRRLTARVGRGQSGTVRLRGNIWRLQFRSEPDEHGRRRQRSVRLGDRREMTFEQACSAAELRMEQLAPRRVAPGSTCSWSAWCDRYVAIYLPNLRGTSRNTVSSIVRRHVRPAFADLQIHEIRMARVQTWIAAMRARGASAETIRGRYNVLRRVLGRARAEGLAVEVPRPGDIDLPRLDAPRTIGVSNALARAYTNEELPRVLDAAAERAPWLATLCMVCTFVGLRVSEALGLKWTDIDLDAGRLRIERQAIGKHELALKTDGSMAERLIPPRLREHLRHYRAASANAEYLFTSPRGGPRDVSGVRRRHLRPLLLRLGINGKSFHAFRHWFGSAGATSGVPLPTLQRAMRHSDVRATQRYIEIDTREVDAAIARVESRFLAASPFEAPKRNAPNGEIPPLDQPLMGTPSAPAPAGDP